MLPANAALLLGGCLLVAHVSGQQPALVKCDSFDSSCPRGHVCDKGSGYCKSPPNQNVECDAFDGSCPKELVCDKSKHCVKSPCGGTCDVCLFMGRCVRVNKGHLVSQGMCEHHKGTWCSGATTTPSPAPTLHVPPPPVVPPVAQGPWGVLAYGFTVAPNEPYFIKTKTQLFSIGSNDVSVITQTTADGKIVFSDSEHMAAARLTKQAGISAKFGPFSAAASMAIGQNTGSSIKTARVDAYCRCKKQRVASKNDFLFRPSTKLHPACRRFILSVDKDKVHKIAEHLGIFFAKSANLGGVVQKTYTMQITEHDTESSISGELKAKYGGWLLGGSLSGGISKRSERGSRGAKMETSFHVEGGNTALWLGLDTIPTDPGAFHDLQQKWAESVTDKNLYPFDVELRPIWELVSEVDKEKGGLLQKYLLQKWQVEASRFNPTEFFKSPVVWPEIYRFTGTVQYTKGPGSHKRILGDFKKTKATCVLCCLPCR